MLLPEPLRDELRRLVASEVRAHAATRAEVAELRAVVAALMPKLSAADHESLHLLLPALRTLRPRALVTAGEVLALAAFEPGPAGDALRLVLARFTGPDPTKALGRLMSRIVGWPVAGVALVRLGSGGKAAALYGLTGF